MFLDFVLFDCVFSVGPTSQKIGCEMTYMYFVEWDVKPKLNYSVTYSKIYFSLVPSIYTPDVIEIGRPFCGRTNYRDPSKFKVT